VKSLLLDTHAWVWSFGADHLLSERARAAITTADVVYLSPISFFEIGQKVRKVAGRR
jgi:PIN domain nuclease of toxin-antitoxin system